MLTFVFELLQLFSFAFVLRCVNAAVIVTIPDVAPAPSDSTPTISFIEARATRPAMSTPYIVVTAIFGCIAAGIAMLLLITYVRSRNAMIPFEWGRGKAALKRDESFFNKPPPPTPLPALVLTPTRKGSTASGDERGVYPTLKNIDSPLRSSTFVSVTYVPNLNYSRPSSGEILPRSKHSSSSTYSSSASLLQVPPPSSPKRETFAQPVVRSHHGARRVYQLHDPGFLPPIPR